jgi:hypothetical protein
MCSGWKRKIARSLVAAVACGLLLSQRGAPSAHAIWGVAEAHAEPSSFLAVGPGYGLKRAESTGTYDRATALSLSIGVASTPRGAIVVGGLFRSLTYFDLGTDISLSLRVATGGFARGQWGLALDVGPGIRSWTSRDYGRYPLGGMLTLGGPWGLQLGVGGEALNLAGSPASQGVVALFELDLLRLTVMRQGATDHYWENPSPAGGKITKAAPSLFGF